MLNDLAGAAVSELDFPAGHTTAISYGFKYGLYSAGKNKPLNFQGLSSIVVAPQGFEPWTKRL